MTTARKPPTPPLPRRTRPLAQPKDKENPLTRDTVQRVRRVIRDSQGKITFQTIAEDTGIAYRSLLEWAPCYRSLPGPKDDNLIVLQRWLVLHDPSYIRDILQSKTPKTIEPVGNMRERA